jgi:ribonuclease T2
MRLLKVGLAAVLLAGVIGAQGREKVGEPGKFDSYLLALSWSPAYCAERGGTGNDLQCGEGRRFAFVLHGLWPQYDNGRWPQFCSTEPGLPDPKVMLDIMPAMGLIRNEWQKHGTCSGLGAEGYFAAARKAHGSVRVPARFQAPREYQVISPTLVKKEFLAANPGMPAEALVVQCRSNTLSEVRVCLDKNLKPAACKGQRGCRAESVRVAPVR